MREILFRAKAINRDPNGNYRTSYKNGDWVYGLLTRIRNDEYPELPAEMVNEVGVSGIDVDYDTVGQYTGLTDKNGVKIFEEDIVKSTETGEIGVVQWFEEHSAFMVYIPNQHAVDYLGEVEPEIIEVCGNVFDNHEILEEDVR